jgi:hypothetical protein
MTEHSANSSAKQDDPEIIEITWQLARLLTIAPSATERQFFGLEYLAPVRHVFPCQQCGEAVARISLRGEASTVDAVLDADSEPFRHHWHANVLGPEHECEGGQ